MEQKVTAGERTRTVAQNETITIGGVQRVTAAQIYLELNGTGFRISYNTTRISSGNSWADTPIGVPDPTILNNFRAQVRYYQDTTDPTTGVSTRTYPGFIVVSQTLTAILTKWW